MLLMTYYTEVKEERKTIIEVTLGDNVLKMKKLIKPEMPKEEQEKIKKAQEEQQKKQEENNAGCPSCQEKAKIRDEIIHKLKTEEGLEPDFKDPHYNTKFRKIWFADERVKKANEEIKKNNENKQGCSSCARKKQLREEVAEELKSSGLKGEELNKKINETVKQRFREEQKNNQSSP